MRSLADSAFLGIYEYFALNSPTWLLQLSLLGFFFFQWGLCFCLLNKGLFYKLGVLGALAFHIGIIPWGWFNLINLVFVPPLLVLLRKNFDTYAFSKTPAGVAAK